MVLRTKKSFQQSNIVQLYFASHTWGLLLWQDHKQQWILTILLFDYFIFFHLDSLEDVRKVCAACLPASRRKHSHMAATRPASFNMDGNPARKAAPQTGPEQPGEHVALPSSQIEHLKYACCMLPLRVLCFSSSVHVSVSGTRWNTTNLGFVSQPPCCDTDALQPNNNNALDHEWCVFHVWGGEEEVQQYGRGQL